MGASGFLGCYMIDVCSGNPKTSLILWLAADTVTVRIYGVEVVGERGMTEVKGAG